jgi:Amt family ammonium transporter
MAVTHIAASAGALAWMLSEWVVRRRPSLLGLCSGVVAGLVAVTPAAGYVTPLSALGIGIAAGIACYWGATTLKRLLKADDSLDVFGVHGVGGIVGSLLTGLLADPVVSGAQGNVLTQLVGVMAVLLYSGLMSIVLLWVTQCIVPLRVANADEENGLDFAQHGEQLGS